MAQLIFDFGCCWPIFSFFEFEIFRFLTIVINLGFWTLVADFGFWTLVANFRF